MVDYLKDLARRIIESGNQDEHVKAKSLHDRIDAIQKSYADQNLVMVFDDSSSNIKWFDKETLEIIEKHHNKQMKTKGAKFTHICITTKQQNDEVVN